MFDLREIIRRNNGTFYHYDTNENFRIRGRIRLEVLAAAVAAIPIVFSDVGFLTSVITVQSILIGFSFSVLFFIASTDDLGTPKSDAIEDKLTAEKLKKLSKELFYNISYFNAVAIGSLSCALALVAPDWTGLINLDSARISNDVVHAANVATEWASLLGQYAMRFAFLFLLIESAYTFLRVLGRVNYLFSRSMSE